MVSNRTNAQTGTFDSLKIDATDDNGVFINWEEDKDENGKQKFTGRGTDSKTYTIRRDEAVPAIIDIV